MTDDDAATWRYCQLNWRIIAWIAVIFGLGLLLTDFQIKPLSYLAVVGIAAIYGVSGWLNATSATRCNARIAFALTAIAQIMLAISLLTSITYIATAANLPLMDIRLLAIDHALGLDFRGYLNFINDRTWLIYLLAAGYRAISWPIWVIVVALPLAGHYRRTSEFIFGFMIALIATTCISTLIPALGVYGAMGLVPSDYPNIQPQAYDDNDAPSLRDGSLRVLDLFRLVGVLTFPSFHAISAILYTWALWPLRWLRPLNLLVNGAMLVATPVGGGHYFIDVIAGAAVAILAISASIRVGRTFSAAALAPANSGLAGSSNSFGESQIQRN